MKNKHVVGFVAALAAAVSFNLPRLALAADPITDARNTLAVFLKTDPSLKRFVDSAAGYVVFPRIGKGGLGVGGAHGNGVVFQRGNVAVARASMTQVTVGAQIGGQEFSEIIFFETPKAMSDFMRGDFTLAAQVSAVALSAGAAKSANYKNGVAVFTATTGGLMLEASVGGQKFRIKPLHE
jgi:lipid-binding SYLF domain-containing protein